VAGDSFVQVVPFQLHVSARASTGDMPLVEVRWLLMPPNRRTVAVAGS
jgi:hypothetical protein